MKNLSSRILSAVIALAVLGAALYFGREIGIYALIFFVVIRGSYELARLFFNEKYPAFSRWTLVAVCTAVYSLIAQEALQPLSTLILIAAFVLITCVGILGHKSFQEFPKVLSFINKSVLSLIYISFLPATVAWTLQTNNGIEWFLCLLAVVFAGDIGAYIFGVNFGKTKIAPLLSPNKSLQGAFGGLLFSTTAACAFYWVVPHAPLSVFIICGFFGGFLGQIGDFFESLVKRISGVKDSGSIMPGHGGLLDRLDGVLMAAPLFYVAAKYFSL